MLEDLILNIEETVKKAKENLAGVVNSTMTETYWLIGKFAMKNTAGIKCRRFGNETSA